MPSQAFRLATQPGEPLAPEIHIEASYDSNTQKHIIRWKDVQQIFDNPRYVRNGQKAVMFLTDDDLEDLIPERIEHHPGVTLEVVTDSAYDVSAREPTPPLSTPVETAISENPTTAKDGDDSALPTETTPHLSTEDDASSLKEDGSTAQNEDDEAASAPSASSKSATSKRNARRRAKAKAKKQNAADLHHDSSEIPALENICLTEMDTLTYQQDTTEKVGQREDQEMRAQMYLEQFIDGELPILNEPGQSRFYEDYPRQLASNLAYSKDARKQVFSAGYFMTAAKYAVVPVGQDVIKAILHIMESDIYMAKDVATVALSYIVSIDENRESVVKYGGLKPLLDLLSYDKPVREGALISIYHISLLAENKLIISKDEELLATIIRLARNNQGEVQKFALRILAQLSVTKESMQNMVRAGATAVLVRLLKTPDYSVQWHCLESLNYITKEVKNLNWFMQSAPGFVKILKEILDSADDTNIRIHALNTLLNLTQENTYQREIVQGGCFASLLRILDLRCRPEVEIIACLLRKLVDIPSNDRLIVNSGLLEFLLGLLRDSKESELRQQVASTFGILLSREGNRESIMTMGLVECIHSIVPNELPNVQSHLTECLALFTLSSELHSRLLRMGILETLIHLSGSKYNEIRETSVNAILELAREPSDPTPFVNHWTTPDSGIHGVIQRALQSSSVHLQAMAICILGGLHVYPALNGLISRSEKIRSGLVQAVESLRSNVFGRSMKEDTGQVIIALQIAKDLITYMPWKQ
ncbi:Vacuolar protein 8 [Mortierella sp. GBA30]|nr:Vacuolar protein 8 [Mortierella sp. GBA30]